MEPEEHCFITTELQYRYCARYRASLVSCSSSCLLYLNKKDNLPKNKLKIRKCEGKFWKYKCRKGTFVITSSVVQYCSAYAQVQAIRTKIFYYYQPFTDNNKFQSLLPPRFSFVSILLARSVPAPDGRRQEQQAWNLKGSSEEKRQRSYRRFLVGKCNE